MKLKFISNFLLALSLISSSVYAQVNGHEEVIKRCYHTEHHNWLIEQNPDIVNQRQALEVLVQDWIKNNENKISSEKAVIVIPVVVHIVYNITAQNISTAQIQSQIDVLNEDFNRKNQDTANTPSAFKTIAANVELQFCLAQRTPENQSTTGITRTLTTKTSFSDNDFVKYTSQGGINAWDTKKYLNIWVCNLSDGILGYAQFPGSGSSLTDGVVIHYKAFGRIGVLYSNYNKGRSATHEIGHWFNLYHIWGDDGGLCSGSDLINDTPNQADETAGCPTGVVLDACQIVAPGIMYHNFMDYTDDACMNLFTIGQKTRMLASLNTSRSGLKSSQGCLPVGIYENDFVYDFSIFPNPGQDVVTINVKAISGMGKVNLLVRNIMGQQLFQKEFIDINEISENLDVSDFNNGIYFVTINSGTHSYTKKLSVIR